MGMKSLQPIRGTILAAGLWLPVMGGFAAERPNFVFFLIDDQDMQELSPGTGAVLTPNLQRLADDGMFFRNAYVTATVCTPSRYTCATGRYPGRSYYPPYLAECPPDTQGNPEFNVGLEPDRMNVGRVLADNGYVTGWVGKFHLGGKGSGSEGEDPGETKRDRKKRFTDPRDPAATEAFRKLEAETAAYVRSMGFTWARHVYPGNIEKPFAEHNLEWTVEAALEFIEQNKDRPFYLHFCTTLLHGPDGSWERSMGFPQVSGEGWLERELRAEMPPRETVRERVRQAGKDHPLGYTWLDDGVGAIMKKLKDQGLEENTVFVYMPDHGSANKASLFGPDGARIPMIIRYPRLIKPGGRCDSLVQTIDLVPTYFDLAGAVLPEGYKLDGKSLRPLFGDSQARIHDSLYLELGCARAVVTNDWKYIAVRYPQDRIDRILRANAPGQAQRHMYYLERGGGIATRGLRYSPEFLSPDQLYNLENDRAELRNLAGHPEYANKMEEMKGALLGHLKAIGRPFGEFIPGKGAALPGQVEEQIAKAKELSASRETDRKKTGGRRK